ncbi:UDP-2,3-diacylglucosamine diphosphatase [Verminephrobacter aporrectodeae subsp. tuberculatae]|uniref:UDP-2,3-diacylglucosamine diphosphatase n=1 Tax=Verminephrobacter aporrectodeae TaxID=1110389 RepID=UPI002238A253|nr:UDP-2,3-diacylglucosamine diphosphatase [Verminephrobacter aporrectodeae]MCW5220525.1 UDP-2,3-diacylglucosamine diphosphatase [Verminephrobacter aporrectodeae subsp. tuberculatae]MCW5255517.1 UDP-2,3-diacylglucosamine diphosphatase [Verminephrobacter aporrectodeae subsp. tuberculatae]MCW5289821.1 UDP-2,3-diacylglucosamine diphosphatase [Verminephrobacter aporrectodeae subsp. tuberculatae]
MHTGVPRFEVLCAPAHWRRVDFISDLHLQAGAPDARVSTRSLWQHYLQTTPADALFILGDLFEVWVGDDALHETGSFEARVCADLQAAARRLPVWFMQGNRDFLAGAAFLGHCGIAALADPAVLVFGGQRILLSHGDLLCLEDRDYQRFRLQVRSAAWQQRFLAQPLAVRRAQARSMRQESEARKRLGAPCADVDAAAAIAWLNAADARTLVHGHTHQPAEHALAPGLQRLVLSDWDAAATPARAEALRLSAAGWQRLAALP